MKKKNIKIALRIVELEKNLFKGGRVADYAAEFEKITEKLSIKDMLEIDEYIQANNLLDKEEQLLTNQ